VFYTTRAETIAQLPNRKASRSVDPPKQNSSKHAPDMNIRSMSALSIAAALSVSALTPLSAAVQQATPISQVAPAYSHDLRASRVEGEVVVSFTISATGRVLNPVVVSSSDRLLEKPTLAAVRKWTFAPAMKDGVAVSERVVQPVAFLMPDLHSSAAFGLATSRSKPATQADNHAGAY
jgi:TonB family protein